MADVVSRGSVEMTIIDLTDNKRLLSYIGTSVPRYVIYNPDNSSYNPDYNVNQPVLTPYLQVDGSTTNVISQASKVTWYYQNNSMGEWTEIESDNPDYEIVPVTYELNIKKNVLALNTFMTYYCQIEYEVGRETFHSLTDIELVKIINGTSGNDPIIAELDNDQDYIHTDADGNGGYYEYAKSSMSIFDGSIDVTNNWKISVNESSGVQGHFNESTGIYQVTGLTSDSGQVTFIGTRGDRRVELTYSIIKIKSGRSGEVNRIYTEYGIIRKDQDDVYIPRNLTIKNQKKVGNEPWKDEARAFRILTSTGDTNFDLFYESESLETSYNLHIPPNISNIEIRTYTDTRFIELLDIEHIPIVIDGKDNIIALIETPNGIVSRNGETILEATMRLYLGDQSVTANSYQWYKRDRSASGDNNSVQGWKPLNINEPEGTSGFASESLTVPPIAIEGSDTFMCIANYNSRQFRSTITLSDINDPYIVNILGSGIFKNNEGINTYTTKVYRNGIEMDTDPLNIIYTYVWNLYDQEGKLRPDFHKTGKTITVDASEIHNISTLICTVNDKRGETEGTASN